MHLVKVQALVLLLQELAFPDIGEEKLLSQVRSLRVQSLHRLQQLGGLAVLAESREDEDQVLDRERVSLVHRLELGHEFLTLAVLSEFHQAVGLDGVEKRLLVILYEAWIRNKRKDQ